MQEDLISIVIPVYNASRYVERCVDRLERQTYKNLEIVLVDDGSKDNTLELCHAVARRNSKVMVLSKSNAGPLLARKMGTIAARGKFVTYLDADDYPADNMYEVLHDSFLKYDCDCVISRYYAQWGPFKIKVKFKVPCGYYNRERMEKEIFPTMLYDESIASSGVASAVWVKMFRTDLMKDVFKEINAPIRIGEDHFQSIALLNKASSCVIIGNYLYHYIVHSGSVMTSYKKNFISETVMTHEEYKKLLGDKFNYTSQIAGHFCYDLCYGLTNYSRLKVSYAEHFKILKDLYEDKIIKEAVKGKYIMNASGALKKSGMLFSQGKIKKLALRNYLKSHIGIGF